MSILYILYTLYSLYILTTAIILNIYSNTNLRQKASLWLHASDLEEKAQSKWQDSALVSVCVCVCCVCVCVCACVCVCVLSLYCNHIVFS